MPNYGEDWSSFHLAIQQGLLIKTGVIYKMQTKKSANLGPDGGVAWTDEALQPICGSYSKYLIQLSCCTWYAVYCREFPLQANRFWSQ